MFRQIRGILRVHNRCAPYIIRYCSRSFTGDKVVDLDENTLQQRLMNSLFIQKTNPNTLLEKYRFSKNINCGDNLSNEDVISLIKLVGHGETPSKASLKNRVVDLDKITTNRLPKLSTSEVFRILDAFITVLPHRITSLTFYNKALLCLFEDLERMPSNDIVKLCFYSGLLKKNELSKKILKRCVLALCDIDLNKLSLTDICIVCNATFKCSCRVSNKTFLQLVMNSIYQNLSILNDPPYFVTLIKFIRQNQCQNEELLETLAHTILFNKCYRYYNFATISHILPLYSDALFFDESLLKTLYECAEKQFKTIKKSSSRKEHLTNRIRGKDICTFLWALSHIGFEHFEENFMRDNIIPRLSEMVDEGDFLNKEEDLIGSILSLWMLGFQPTDLIVSSLTLKNVNRLKAKHKRKYDARLNLLCQSILIENKSLFDKLKINIAVSAFGSRNHAKIRPLLSVALQSLEQLQQNYNIVDLKITTQIPHLDIAGIQMKIQNHILNIEVLDDDVCLSNVPGMPHGLMKLKLRLIRNSNDNLFIVSKTDFEDKDVLKSILERKIQYLLK